MPNDFFEKGINPSIKKIHMKLLDHCKSGHLWKVDARYVVPPDTGSRTARSSMWK